MEQSDGRPHVDSVGNKWFIKDGIVLLKLASENYERRLGLIYQDRFIVYKTREKHLFRKANAYGFNYDVIEELSRYHGINWVDLYDDYGMYRLPIDTIREGEVLFFKEQGFELQRFVSVDILEFLYSRELPEDENRKKLMGESWFNQLRAEFHKPYWNKLGTEVTRRRNTYRVYPEKEDVFKAFQLTPYEDVRVVIMGQDFIKKFVIIN